MRTIIVPPLEKQVTITKIPESKPEENTLQGFCLDLSTVRELYVKEPRSWFAWFSKEVVNVS